MNEALSMSEQFVEKYQITPLARICCGVVVIVGAILGVRHFYLLPREDKAQLRCIRLLWLLKTILSIWRFNGNEKFDGLLTIVDQYGSTAAGNLANAYLDWLIMK